MSKPIFSQWKEEHPGIELSENRIREILQPATHYRITSAKYSAGTAFGGYSQEGSLYIMEGKCQLTLQGMTYTVSRGDIALCPKGDYQIKVLGNDVLHIVKAWHLPVNFRSETR